MQEKSNKITEISERLYHVIDYLDVTKNEFAKKLGYERSQTVYDVLNSKSAPSFDFFNRLYNSEYSECINPVWLLTGKGSMLLKEEGSYSIVSEPTAIYGNTIHPETQSIPLYNVEASAGIVSLFQDTSHSNPIDYIRIPGIPACDGAIPISGDSMYPLLKSGDIVLYKQVSDPINGIYFFGEMYIIGISQDGEDYVVVKYIQRSDLGDDYIKLVSQNQHHDPFDVPKSAIRALAIVRASIRINSMK